MSLQLTVGDLALMDLMDIILQRISPDALENQDKLKAHRERVCNSPRIKKWLETRPQTEMWKQLTFMTSGNKWNVIDWFPLGCFKIFWFVEEKIQECVFNLCKR